MNTNDDLSAYCKAMCGMDATDVANLANIPRRTFHQWWHSRRSVVELIVKGVAADLHYSRVNAELGKVTSELGLLIDPLSLSPLTKDALFQLVEQIGAKPSYDERLRLHGMLLGSLTLLAQEGMIVMSQVNNIDALITPLVEN